MAITNIAGLMYNWDNWNRSAKAQYLARWSRDNKNRKPKGDNKNRKPKGKINGGIETIESFLSKYVKELRMESDSYNHPDYEVLRGLDWWMYMIGECPSMKQQSDEKHQVKSLKKSRCDMCRITYYCDTVANKRTHGYPLYLLCHQCYEWSIPKRMRIVSKKLQGSISKPPTSGKKFNASWNNVYKKTPQKMEKESNSSRNEDDIDDKENQDIEHDENEQLEDITSPGYIGKTTDAMKDAVHVVESGVSGLFHGASEALSSLSPFSKTR